MPMWKKQRSSHILNQLLAILQSSLQLIFSSFWWSENGKVVYALLSVFWELILSFFSWGHLFFCFFQFFTEGLGSRCGGDDFMFEKLGRVPHIIYPQYEKETGVCLFCLFVLNLTSPIIHWYSFYCKRQQIVIPHSSETQVHELRQ